ncbi:phosphonate ABC transporter ATP-binding protein [Levilactobacillus tujiorum]|uniref:Phosphonate ABC transporter ATP-binding protein n=1 Tax=Levilactobacillus tujiorum TaxID=2912243 RepID=A0ABX1L7F7_9LACO|nr:phosphonate ABC transporter ATP-binding protein [Levilactobacillus tujiorum]MCH5465209.1 phosphonate ABC transporter ATP-binding protein [Levilactobacillus tujiorum]NLR12234.1 phosphonate ABC transporter ATP-binding protein [Lactobacillus sp. HBUAS51387]NLR29812.1 phosphonate ABC transporter ATP-binding protein [Levilactobacillus tujiorum]
MVQETPIISFKNVNKVYDNGTVGLKDINFDIPRGQFLVVVGLSGAGKSTLLRTINRMHEITSGEIRVEDEAIDRYKGRSLRFLRRKIGMIFQNFNLVKRSSVERNVLSGRVSYYPTWKSLLGLFSAPDKQKAVQALQRVSLAEKLYARADELSGGQQQRVAIARTLMQNPKIILADEPIASLDPLTTKTVMDILKRLNQEDGITVIVNLHSVTLAREYADRIVGLRAGEVVYDEPIAAVTATDLNRVYQEV